jgi:hypothetical protein
MTHAVAVFEGGVPVCGWPDGPVPRTGEIVEVDDGRFIVRHVVYGFSRQPAVQAAPVTAFVLVERVHPLIDKTRPAQVDWTKDKETP